MKIVHLVGLLLVLILSMSLLSVSTASAGSGNPLFVPANNQTVTGTSGAATLKSGSGEIVICQKSTATGNITSSLLIGKVFVHYLECRAKLTQVSTTTCTIKSTGAPEEGLIITKELHGILGLILPSLQTGILFLPTVGNVFVDLDSSREGGTQCTETTKVTGTVAGIIEPVGKAQKTGKIIFPTATIKTIDLTHGLGLREPELQSYAQVSTLEQEVAVQYGQITEVT